MIAQLQLGTYYGGGAHINGEVEATSVTLSTRCINLFYQTRAFAWSNAPQDPLLSEVKAFVPAECVCLKLPADILTGKMSDDVTQLLRNEAAFQLTYYLGRQVRSRR